MSAANAQDPFVKHEVVPDTISTSPPAVATVTYPDEDKVKVELGKELKPRQVRSEPKIEWKAEDDTLYTVTMVDLDPPSRAEPKFREILHWLVVNVPKNDLSKGLVLAEYIGSGPPEKAGLHRYVFLVYKQKDKLNPDEKPVDKKTIEGRMAFKIRDFAKKYNLGEPIAGNFYQAEWDDYVPEMRKQFVQQNPKN